MKKFILLITMALCLTGCHYTTKNFGGNMTIELPKGQKLEEITWKDTNLWYLTRPMRENEVAEIHTFQEKSPLGIAEGTVTIIETK